MTYKPDLQYRCTIIRGKSISKMDDFLPVYAETLNSICPITKDKFNEAFDRKLSEFIKDDEKTIRNHRTENVSKLLGMYYEKEGIIYKSRRTNKFLKDNDQPAFFKSICFRFQQPNGSQKIGTIMNKVSNDIQFKPYHFILALLKLAYENSITLRKSEIAYYALNSLEVLQGKVSFNNVFNMIMNDRHNNSVKMIRQTKAYSYHMQHINEQFDYLELANLVRKNSVNIWINTREMRSIDYFIDNLDEPLMFDFNNYHLSNPKELILDWQEYYGYISHEESDFLYTNISSLKSLEPTTEKPFDLYTSTLEIGEEGENFVLEIEKDIVKSFNPRLVNKVNYHGKMKGLGYDITSIEAGRDKANPEFIRYIEVKATKRVSPPSFTNTLDTINLTRNEWVAAEQHSKHFYIYRIYFTSEGTYVNIINDPIKKNNDGVLYAQPVNYRIEFGVEAIDEKNVY